MIKNRSCIHGIYGILPSGLATDTLLKQAEEAMRGGVLVLQYRDKTRAFKRARKQCLALRALCHHYHCALIINDSVQLAKDCDADGVHLGREDISNLAQTRNEIGGKLCMGITCRGDAALAQHALACGADYISFGAIFATTSKKNVPVIGLARLQKARSLFPDASICAIGGINVDTILPTRMCGADAVAVISSLFSSTNIEQQARTMVAAWEA
ncbi:MAG: thiamine phosphate synthase [Mariprofundaceae bacterium]|nr:thiamine phosphate synthase [Mariprofundaceae bacterium]